MTTAIEYALMAGASYISNRPVINRLPAPDVWLEAIEDRKTTASGFEATYFVGVNNEVVISFAGTDFSSGLFGTIFSGDFWYGNIPLITGISASGADQLVDAVEYYLKVKAANPNATISLTGHSLGGALAALVGVFFGETAFTFDQVPAAQTALSGSATLLRDALLARGHTTTELAGLNSYIDLQQTNGGIPNEGLVTNLNVKGEVAGLVPAPRIGSQASIDNGSSGVSASDLHSIALLTTFLQSNKTAEPFKNLSDVTFKLTDLLKMIFDKNLYASDPLNKDAPVENFLERLVKHEAGVQGSITADAMVTRFTSDLWKLAQDGGMTMQDGNADTNRLSKALIAFAMQKYYEEKQISAGYNKELFTDLATEGSGSGGIHFDIADVSDKFAIALANNEKLNLSDAKGYDLYLKYFFAENIDFGDNFTVEEDALILSMLPYMRDWYVQAGLPGMIASDANGFGNGAFMLGGTADDYLTGGTGADLLVGNAGDDVLSGGMGNDFLLGGKGNDTYKYNTGEGFDTLLDRDGQGSIVVDGITLAGGAQYGDKRVFRGTDANGQSHLYTLVNGDLTMGGDLIVDGAVLIKDYQPTSGNHMGFSMDGPVADVDPVPTTTVQLSDLTDAEKVINSNTTVNFHLGNEYDDGTYQRVYFPISGTGSYKYGDDGVNAPGYQPYNIDNFPVYASAVRRGELGAVNDYLIGSGNDDLIYLAGDGGNDIIEAGAGHDTVYSGSGNDVISGGADSDILNGGGGNDRLYGDAQISVADAIEKGNLKNTGTGIRGDWLAGGEGDDTLIGSTANDVLTGGNGSDLLIGGAGDDDILGDISSGAMFFEWTATTQPSGLRLLYGTDSDVLPTVGAVDVIYAGEGNDHVFGGFGNDVIFGEGGDDRLTGEQGNDIILGGAGKDHLWGDDGSSTDATAGNDYLDGGQDDDIVNGNAGDDIIIGGRGNDTLYGGAGRDTYIFNAGDGTDTLYDTSDNTQSNTNILRFGAGISEKDITLRLGSLMLDLGNGDAVHIEGFNQNDVFNSSSISGFEFADGTSLTTNELLARGFDIDGTEGDDSTTGTTDINGIITITDHALYGTNITDRINGLGGNDLLFGMAGDDILDGGDGNDQLVGDDGAGLSSGNDMLNGGAGDDYIWGNGGDDTLIGGTGNDTLQGEAGNDTLIGGDGNDQLQGGAGNDILNGGAGDDVYYYSLGEGVDHITDSGGTDWLVLGNGATSANLRLDVDAGSLKMVFSDGSELHLDDFDPANPLAGSIEYIQFSDRQVLRREQMIQALGFNIQGATGDNVLSGTSLGETITAYGGNDVVTALGGNDTVNLGAGNDYADAGDGNDTVQGEDGNDTIYGGNGADTLNGGAGNDTLYGDAGADYLIGGLGDDLLSGGVNDDTLDGGEGNDTYLFGRGSGQDIVYDYDTTAGNIDKIQIAADVLPGDVTVRKSGENLYLSISNPDGTTDKLTFANWYSGDAYKIEQVVFADGTVWDVLMLDALINAPSQGADYIEGTSGNDVLNGLGGDDTLMGYAGDDTLDGGAGNDSLQGGTGNDTYLFGRGSGQDVVYDYDTTAGNLDKIQIAADLLPSDVIVSRDQNHLYLSISNPDGTTDKLTLANWYSGDAYKVEEVAFADGTLWDVLALNAMLNVPTEGADIIDGTSSNDVLNGLGGNDTLRGYAGDDTLDGGTGNDSLQGDTGRYLLVRARVRPGYCL